MVVIDNNKNVYDIRFYDNNGVEWSEDFFNTGSWNTVEVGSYIAYECETDISELIDYMDDFLYKEGDFIDDDTPVNDAFYYVSDLIKLGFINL